MFLGSVCRAWGHRPSLIKNHLKYTLTGVKIVNKYCTWPTSANRGAVVRNLLPLAIILLILKKEERIPWTFIFWFSSSDLSASQNSYNAGLPSGARIGAFALSLAKSSAFLGWIWLAGGHRPGLYKITCNTIWRVLIFSLSTAPGLRRETGRPLGAITQCHS